MSDLSVLDRRPDAGQPRDYDFPDVERSTLPGGLTLLRAHVPGRPLLQAQLIVRGDAGGGAVSEEPAQAGVSVLAARALSEGTARHDAVAFTEASERLGASLAASCGWDSLGAHVEVPKRRLAPALDLLAEMTLQPSFPEREMERLREERLNDLKQTMADPRRRVERLYPSVIYADGAAYGRLMGGSEETVPGLDRAALVARHARLMRPDACTLIVCGDLVGLAVEDIVGSVFQGWPEAPADDEGLPASDEAAAGPGGGARVAADTARPDRRVVIVDRPGAPQSEVRVGHVGASRRIDDFHALVVTNALLGGLFNSRLNRLLREERGYTYGVHSDFDMRRAAGPFAVRCAVETEVTAPAVGDILAELERLRQGPVSDAELTTARDYLVGVFPLRFETSAQVAGAVAGLVVHGLAEDELDRYRPAVASVSADDVLAAARRHIDPARASVVIVGDAARFREALETAGLEDIEVISDQVVGSAS
jgi:predicted Zn-dependent peptidase